MATKDTSNKNEFISLNVPYSGFRANPPTWLIKSIIIIILIQASTHCHDHFELRPESSMQFQYYDLPSPSEDHDHYPTDSASDWPTESALHVTKRTPPLDSKPELKISRPQQVGNDELGQFTNRIKDRHKDVQDVEDIKPERIYMNYDNGQDIFSPIFNFQLTNPLGLANIELDRNQPVSPKIPLDSFSQDDKVPDGNFELDFVDQGSGDGWSNPRPDEIIGEATQNFMSIMPTPSLDSDGRTAYPPNDNFNRPPKLNKRIPKLSIVAGQVWRYLIPYDIFLDEDGDLRNLNSTIIMKSYEPLKVNLKVQDSDTSSADDRQFYSWLQYNPNQQLLYGLPSDNDAGLHRVSLLVSDRWGALGEEMIEIYVRQHPSVRAFTHQFSINSISWNKQGWSSMVDAVGELLKRLSESVLFDEPFRDSIVQFYAPDKPMPMNSSESISNTNQSSDSSIKDSKTFSLGWSNSSIPVHPCNLSLIELVVRSLADDRSLSISGAFENLDKNLLTPSGSLLKTLGPEFSPSFVSFSLEGACERKTYLPQSHELQKQDAGHDAVPRVNTKIGKLTWKLGEPIEYKIPDGIFAIDSVAQTAYPLELTLHTIDGMSLDKDPRYSFMDFDPATRTLFGLSYDQDLHSGQKELQLTARHPINGHKAREVFIINIEPQDLTIVNNRAFKLALYLTSRSGVFGPRERLNLSRKLATVFEGSNVDFSHDQKQANFIVFAVQRLAVKKAYYPPEGDYNDKLVRRLDDIMDQGDELSRDSADEIVYKFSWTNENIGNNGNCPVEVIRDKILGALERQMFDLELDEDGIVNETSKPNSDKFHDRLNFYFEPEIKVIDLRFEPIAACAGLMDLNDVGNNELADQIDRAVDEPYSSEVSTYPSQTPIVNTRIELEPNSDEYWSIIVLIILVIALIFVIVMFFLGMHTYKINQDKRFELQVKLSQARQNSMFLSSMMLANHQATGAVQFESQMLEDGPSKSAQEFASQQDEDGFIRRPVILDNEKQLLMQNGDAIDMKSTTVQLEGHSVMTRPVKSDTRLKLDSLAGPNWRTVGFNESPSRLMLSGHHQADVGFSQRSMTLGHRARGASMQRFQAPMMSESPSVLTVGSNMGPVQLMGSIGMVPVMYTTAAQPSYSSLQRNYVTRPHEPEASKMGPYVTTGDGMPQRQRPQQLGNKTAASVARFSAESPSCVSSASGPSQSMVSQANYTVI